MKNKIKWRIATEEEKRRIAKSIGDRFMSIDTRYFVSSDGGTGLALENKIRWDRGLQLNPRWDMVGL